MKAYIIAALAIIASSSSVKAQQGVKLTLRYLPQHTYNSKISINVEGNVNTQGNSPVADSLKAKGIPQNLKVSVKATANVSAKTGVESGGMTPVTIRLESISAQPTLNGQPIPALVGLLQGKAIYVRASTHGKLQLDSVSGKRLPDSTLTRINSMMSMAMSRMQLPDKTFKPGESYTQEVPLFFMPMKGMPQPNDAKAKITYRLVKITGNKAYFDFTQSSNFSDNKNNTVITVNGNGTGSMVYEIKEHYPSSYQSNARFTMHAAGAAKSGADGSFTIQTSGTTTLN